MADRSEFDTGRSRCCFTLQIIKVVDSSGFEQLILLTLVCMY
jgi:hypothetical protein